MGEKYVHYNTEIPTEYALKYRLRKPTSHGDFYYGKDSDMLYKTWAATKRGAVLGFFSGLGMSTYHPVGGFAIGPALEKFYRHGLPPVIAAAAFGAGLSLAANIRKKEDCVNHAIGGYAAGTMIGVWYKAPRVGVFGGLFLALLASSCKAFSDAGAFEVPVVARRERVFDFYRTGWMIDRPSQEGIDDHDKNDAVRHYAPGP